MSPYELLSEIYRLLDGTSLDAIADARRLVKGDEVRSILDSFERTKRILDRTRVRSPEVTVTEPDRAVRTTSEVKAQELQPALVRDAALTEREQLKLLIDHARKLGTGEVVRALSRSGLRVRYSTKDSRSRVLSRAVAAFQKLPTERRPQVMRRLRNELGIDETKGWIERLRASRDSGE